MAPDKDMLLQADYEDLIDDLAKKPHVSLLKDIAHAALPVAQQLSKILMAHKDDAADKALEAFREVLEDAGDVNDVQRCPGLGWPFV